MKHDPFDWRTDSRMRHREIARMPMAHSRPVMKISRLPTLLLGALLWAVFIGVMLAVLAMGGGR